MTDHEFEDELEDTELNLSDEDEEEEDDEEDDLDGFTVTDDLAADPDLP